MKIFYKLLINIVSIYFMASISGLTWASDTVENTIKKLIEPRLGPGIKVDTITKTPYAGLYEIQVNGDIIYTDAEARYLFIGHVVNTQTYQDYTKEKIEAINKIRFSELPLDLAIKVMQGKGERVIAVFEDPNCGYCKQFQRTLQTIDNLTIYVFQYNILKSDSVEKSSRIWCTAKPREALEAWMIHGRQEQVKTIPAECSKHYSQEVHNKVLALGKKLKITGTPTIFFTDGSRIAGSVDAKVLEHSLVAIAKNRP